MSAELLFTPGQQVKHPDFGVGVIIAPAGEGYFRVSFPGGRRLVPGSTIVDHETDSEEILGHVRGARKRPQNIWLYLEAHSLPLTGHTAALTAAPIKLLPHQIVLTHNITQARPRRFLIADEVGLGKTIEAALIIRELDSRGELGRALIIVPAGLVSNWNQELNNKFNLNFDVFGSSGDVTDNRTNAFAKYHRLIASIDTLKQKKRIKNLEEAPPWDLVVFDEAHNLSAHKSGKTIKKTQKYRLAETLAERCRDLLLLTATPHQGKNFHFWKLIELLNPELFVDDKDMLSRRHLLNQVMYRRTKADACDDEGQPIFSRRKVHTLDLYMQAGEKEFYEALHKYLKEGFSLAKKQGSKGNSLGFAMCTFQKISASSFAAIAQTLRRRLLRLTLLDAYAQDEQSNIEERDERYDEARRLIAVMEGISDDDSLARALISKRLEEEKVRAIKGFKKQQQQEFEASGEDRSEDDAVGMSVHWGAERLLLADLLAKAYTGFECKINALLELLHTVWNENPDERVVVFATYLGTVNQIQQALNEEHSSKGVAVLKGGNDWKKRHSERAFNEGTVRVLICTAAGQEGINLQRARVLVNFDLPWNPMVVEQRIGRIHRYGQKDTAQVYNLVLQDTIEGKVYQTLQDKIKEITQTIGNRNSSGDICEELDTQIIGQLSERLDYNKLYQEAISDPELRRTDEQIGEAMKSAKKARKVQSQLFQNLNGFSLDEYTGHEDASKTMDRIIEFLRLSLPLSNRSLVTLRNHTYSIQSIDEREDHPKTYTTERQTARDSAGEVELLGLDHPIVVEELQRHRELSNFERGTVVRGPATGVICWWHVTIERVDSQKKNLIRHIAVSYEGDRLSVLEEIGTQILVNAQLASSKLAPHKKELILSEHLEPMLRRNLQHDGLLEDHDAYNHKLLAWVEVVR